jgi:O-antigen ligase
VLLPGFLELRRQPDVPRFGALLPDKLLAGYLVLLFVLQLPHESFTETLRARVFYAFTDVLLPYYVASRGLRHLPALREALMAFVLGALALAAIACFEALKSWLVYAELDRALGVPWDYGGYLLRGDSLRAQGTAGHAIPLGFVMAVALGLALALRPSIPRRLAWAAGLALLAAGLMVPLSRGPWVGAAVLVVVFVAIGPAALKRFAALGVLGVAVAPALVSSSAGRVVIDLLPYVGSAEAETITYRERLVEISFEVIRQNPWFGVFDATSLAVMQQLKQGQGIIDIVNTYVGVALESGLVGLALFAGFFLCVGAGIAARLRSLPGGRDGEAYRIGRALFATLVGILVIISTVSSITIIPLVYWSVAGLGVAYARMRWA